MASKTSRSQSSRGNVVTLNMIVDILPDFEVQHTPRRADRNFSWCIYPHGNRVEIPRSCKIEDVLILANIDTCARVMESSSKSQGLLFLRIDEPFDTGNPPFSRAVMDRLLIMRAKKAGLSILDCLSMLEARFFDAYRWSSECENIISSGGSIQDLVDCSAPILQNWVDISDGTYNLVAYTKDIDPPDKLSARLVKNGSHSEKLIGWAASLGYLREWKDHGRTEIFEPDERVPFRYITRVLQIDGAYAGHVIMVCNQTPLTPGLEDLFNAFADECARVMTRDNEKSKVAFSAYRDFFVRLVEEKNLAISYTANQRAIIGIDERSWYCLYLIDYAHGAYAKQPTLLLETIHETFSSTLAMVYRESILVLSYSTLSESGEADSKLRLMVDFCNTYDCLAYSSNVYKDIADTRLAYEQIALAVKHHSTVVASDRIGGIRDDRRHFTFIDTFCYATRDILDAESDFSDFCFNTTPLDTIVELEQNRDVPDIRVLYCYLRNERKATPTAEQLHMHRNNVLYRIRTIEKRYGIDLDDFNMRQYLLTIYDAKISHSLSFRSLLAGSRTAYKITPGDGKPGSREPHTNSQAAQDNTKGHR